MNQSERLIEFCRSLPAATEDVKWGDNLVFSVGKKMFAVFDVFDGFPVSFKVEPMVFEALTSHQQIVPAPYLARHSWVMVKAEGALPDPTLEDLVGDSYEMVVDRLTKKTKVALGLKLNRG